MLMHAEDMHALCKLMAEQILRAPSHAIFQGMQPPRTSRHLLAGVLEVITRTAPPVDAADAEFPAHDGFIGGRKTMTEGRVSRKEQKKSAPTICRRGVYGT